MPVKARIAKRRRPSINREAVALFVRLEGMTPQCGRDFERGSHQLARELGLVPEWWTGNHVNDRSRGPCHPPHCVAHGDWHTCREVREALLASANQLQQ
jgi:hypothetical protein